MASSSLSFSSSSLPSLPAIRPPSRPTPLFPFSVLPSGSTGHRAPLLLSTAAAAATRSSNPSAASMSEEMRHKIFESYGLDPAEFVSQPSESSTRKRRKGRGMDGDQGAGTRRHLKVPPEDPTSSARTTHKLLQVLGGKACRKKLLSPKGMDVRPMMEVVKGAAFDILQAAGGCPASLRPGRWLDLYSGTGSVGIEAISRGCSEVHFVEMDPWVVSEVLHANLEWTGFLDFSVIHTIRVERFLELAEQTLDDNMKFDYISVTPPYTAVDYNILMEQLSKSPLIGEDCFIMVEYPLKTMMVDSCAHLIKIADRRFGRTNLLIYGPKWAEKKRKPK